ncbi:MAG: flagellar biosynthesis protein FliQ [bacterium]|nr:flagellar biosynthesis protein FliQ [bacterium]
MHPEDIYADIGQRALIVSVIVSIPLLGATLIVGILISIFQAVTSIQEMTLTFIPKILVVAAVLYFLGPWMGQILISFSEEVLGNLPAFIG